MAPEYDAALLQRLCDEAGRETDPARVLELTQQITDLLDRKPPQIYMKPSVNTPE